MSPQALAGASPDARFDLWSLAVVLFEALAGRHPVERESWSETLAAIQEAHIPDVRTWAEDCPDALAVFLAEALGPEIRRRPQTAREFRDRWASAIPGGAGAARSAA
jgi:serine/threonine protein kinase